MDRDIDKIIGSTRDETDATVMAMEKGATAAMVPRTATRFLVK